MYDTQMITELREMAAEISKQIPRAKKEGAIYLTGSRDMLLSLAKLYELRSPIAVLFFNSPVVVVEV